MIRIGIDPGTKTGVGIYDLELKKLVLVETMRAHQLHILLHGSYKVWGKLELVVFEDARMATYRRKLEYHKAQGAGSIKRDCTIIEEICVSNNLPYKKTRPRKESNQMLSGPKGSEFFNKNYGWEKRTSHHARIGAYLAMYG